MKLNEIHRAPSFWSWVRKSAGAVGAVLALWGGYDKLNDKIIVPIQRQREAQARDAAERRARFARQEAKQDTILMELRFIKRRLSGRGR